MLAKKSSHLHIFTCSLCVPTKILVSFGQNAAVNDFDIFLSGYSIKRKYFELMCVVLRLDFVLRRKFASVLLLGTI